MGDRELRAQLEALQARAQQARLALAAPPEVEAERRVLEDEAARLATRRDELAPRAEAAQTSMAAREHVVRQVKSERRVELGRALGRGGAVMVASLGAGVVGGMLGGLALYVLLSTPHATWAVWTASAVGGLGWLGLMYLLGHRA